MNALFEGFQEFRKILCVCPCCGMLHRVSDLRLRIKGKAAKTWLDDYDGKMQSFAKKEEKFGEEEAALREKAIERGRKEAEKIIMDAMAPSLKPFHLDPLDLKPILHPIDFIAFNGMNAGSISSIMLLCQHSNCAPLGAVRGQIRSAVDSKSYDWQVARMSDDGGVELE